MVESVLANRAVYFMSGSPESGASGLPAAEGSLFGRIGRRIRQLPPRNRWSRAAIALAIVVVALAVALGGGDRRVRVLAAGQNVFVSTPYGPQAWMGVTVDDGAEQGAVVRTVQPGSPAAAAGIEVGDLITELDGTRVAGSRQFTRMIGETPVGRTVAVTIARDGAPQVLNVTLSEPAGLTAAPYGELRFAPAWNVATTGDGYRLFFGDTLRLGLRIEDMTPELREFFGADADAGVLVTSVEEDSAAADAGVLVGDVIIAADGTAVDSRADLSWSSELDGETVTLSIIRNRSERDVPVTLEIPQRSWRIAP